jgi:phage-related minor tail protein
MKAKREEATRFLADLGANVDAWYAGQINYEAFGARQRATWDAIHAAGPAVAEQVLRALRDRMPPARSNHEGRA